MTAALAVVALPILVGVVFMPKARSTWSGLEARCAEVVHAHAGEPAGPLFWAPDPAGSENGDGNVWDRYMHTLETAGRYGIGSWCVPRALLNAENYEETARAHALQQLKRSKPVMEELRVAVSAPDRAFDYDWSAQGLDPDRGPKALRTEYRGQELSFVGVGLAARASEHFLEAVAAEDPDAVEFLLDGLQLSSDLAALPLLGESRYGAEYLVPDGLLQFGEEEGWSKLPPEALKRLIDALDRADSGLGTIGDAQSMHLVLEARCFGLFLLGPLKARDSAVRFAISPLVASMAQDAAQVFDLLFDMAAAHRTALEKAPKEGGAIEPTAAIDSFAARVKGSEQYQDWAPGAREIFDDCLQELRYHSEGKLHGLARLRLLRRALYDLTGRKGGPEQTRLGHPLKVLPTDSGLRYLVDHPFYAAVAVVVSGT